MFLTSPRLFRKININTITPKKVVLITKSLSNTSVSQSIKTTEGKNTVIIEMINKDSQ